MNFKLDQNKINMNGVDVCVHGDGMGERKSLSCASFFLPVVIMKIMSACENIKKIIISHSSHPHRVGVNKNANHEFPETHTHTFVHVKLFLTISRENVSSETGCCWILEQFTLSPIDYPITAP
jgi:hypothetical protein